MSRPRSPATCRLPSPVDTLRHLPSAQGRAEQPDRSPGRFLGLNLDEEQVAPVGRLHPCLLYSKHTCSPPCSTSTDLGVRGYRVRAEVAKPPALGSTVVVHHLGCVMLPRLLNVSDLSFHLYSRQMRKAPHRAVVKGK